ncbi:Bifunctional purine biosynthetic protein ADE5,7 [Entomophthora muscae]|uniref:Bifunctional purine biosynthetic protein ADE5,7 n=1 Tax=Entomophthora muscae TaxID=34485 RepID=A0ACC2SSY1_9FUNG|nr:Bifunctional purine biosynthetic protein ADE5,7 [Entomophthora muscae]
MDHLKIRVLVMISGSGTNLQALIDKIQVENKLPNASIVGVISNRSKAFGLERAQKHGIPTSILALKPFKDEGKTRVEYDIALADLVLSYNPTIVVLAGFMHILSSDFLSRLPNLPIINLHPALPGQFDGARAIERAYDAFKLGQIQHTGVMVHKVIAEVDQGAPIITKEVPIFTEDSLESLETRIHEAEHDLLFLGLEKAISELSN